MIFLTSSSHMYNYLSISWSKELRAFDKRLYERTIERLYERTIERLYERTIVRKNERTIVRGYGFLSECGIVIISYRRYYLNHQILYLIVIFLL